MRDRRLVITADDFGAAVEVNAAVERAAREGVLTAASLMVGAPAAADAVERARRLPRLGVGLHLVLTSGVPVLPPQRLRRLVDRRGRFGEGMALAGARMFFSGGARTELAAEIEAQFAAFAATGLVLDHVNAHRHFHLHPTILGLILRIGPRYGLRALRWPREPRRVLARLERDLPAPNLLAQVWTRLGAPAAHRGGLLVPDQVFGVAWSGAMTQTRLTGLIEAAPAGLTEIYLHPATSARFTGAARGYRYAEELDALVSSQARAAAARSGARLGRFADFANDPAGAA